MRGLLLGLACMAGPLALRAQTDKDPAVSLPLCHLQVNSGYGYRHHPLTGKARFHAGIDLAARRDTVFAVLDGIVSHSGYHPVFGLYVTLRHGQGFSSSYGHLSRWWVLAGDTVRAGEPMGLSGATGQVTGEHLHFAVQWDGHSLNPLLFLKALYQGYTRDLFHVNILNHE